jgi:hypothetical protein
LRQEDISQSPAAPDWEFKVVVDSSRAVRTPKPYAIWDFGVTGAVPIDVRELDTGRPDPHFISLYSRHAVVVGRLFGGMRWIGPAAHS